jgi:hypothetical protein
LILLNLWSLIISWFGLRLLVISRSWLCFTILYIWPLWNFIPFG